METSAVIRTYLRELQDIGWSGSRYIGDSYSRVQDEIGKVSDQNISSRVIEKIVDFFAQVGGVDRRTFKTLDQQVLIPGFIPLTASEALGFWSKRTYDASRLGQLLPVMTDYSDSYICVNFSSNEGVEGLVYEWIRGFLPLPLWRGVDELFLFYAEAVRRGVVYLEDGKYLEQDDQRLDDLLEALPSLAMPRPA